MKHSRSFFIVFSALFTLVILAGCMSHTLGETISAPSLSNQAVQSTKAAAAETSVAAAGAALTPSSTPRATAAPTSTPTPTPTATPTPTPTPTPEYIEPVTDKPVWYNGYVDPRTVRAEVVTNASDIDVLINKYYAIPKDYVPDLVMAGSSAGQYLRPEADDAWDAMRAACQKDCGEVLYLVSGYRSYADQTYSFSNAIVRRGLDKTCEKNAYQGRSEHNLGLALDINIASDPEIRDGFAETTAGKWVNEHGHEYGFIQRYQRDKGSITGYGYEAWHYRYVGVKVATAIYKSGQTLEEYYGKEQVLPGKT
jgi:D-alanyl-D-alanine carboxypeptidase